MVTACCSAIPTSKTRSGWSSANSLSPVGMSIAAVIATTSSRSRATPSRASPNSSVQIRPLTCSGNPVSGLIRSTAWNRSASSLRAWS